MLIDISITNYLSFKNTTTFTLQSALSKKNISENVFQLNNNTGILKTAAIYGYNASGKTNLLKAILTIKTLIVNSRKLGPNEPFFGLGGLFLQPFWLNDRTRNEPVEFKIRFEIDGTLYRYEFSLDGKKIYSEILYCKKTQKEKILFKRNFQNIKIYDFNDNDSILRVNENNLALSTFAKEGSIEAKLIHKFFQEIYIFFGDGSPRDSEDMMLKEYETFKPFLRSLLYNADLGIEDINFSMKEIPFNQFPNSENLKVQLEGQGIPIPKNIEHPMWSMYHSVFDDEGNIIGQHSFGVNDESKGTNKILNLAGSIYNVIRQGKILFIDEIDSSLHSSLLLNLINSFNKAHTDSHYQIVFTTQNTHILDIKKTLRRDQIRFITKDKFGTSNLSRLSDEPVRKEYISEKNYYLGKFGGLKGNDRSDLINI